MVVSCLFRTVMISHRKCEPLWRLVVMAEPPIKGIFPTLVYNQIQDFVH